jgi:hypothetical protein
VTEDAEKLLVEIQAGISNLNEVMRHTHGRMLTLEDELMGEREKNKLLEELLRGGDGD